jgi:hypothetical protein
MADDHRWSQAHADFWNLAGPRVTSTIVGTDSVGSLAVLTTLHGPEPMQAVRQAQHSASTWCSSV